MNQETDVSSTSMFGTTAGCKLKMRHWLVVQTDSKAYPGLRWLDEEKTLLRIPWKHGSNGGWNVQDGKLFENWAFYSGKFDPTRPKNSRKFKANFRCALRSLSDVIEVKEKSRKTGKDACKVFKFLEERRRRPVGSLRTSTAITTVASVTSGSSQVASSSSTSSPGSQRSHATVVESDSHQQQSTFANCHNNHFIFNNYIAAPVATASATLAASALMEMRRQSSVTDHIPPPGHLAHGSGKLEYSTGSGQYSAMLSASSTTEYDRHYYHYYHHYFNGASGYTNGSAAVAVGGNGLDGDWRDITEFLKEEAEQMTYNRSYYNFQ